MTFFFSWNLWAAEAPAKSAKNPKSQLNTQIYEHESEESSFEAVVKIIRNIQGDTEVFFEGKQGFYTLSSENLQALLVESQKKKAPVRVTINSSSRQILKVEWGPKSRD